MAASTDRAGDKAGRGRILGTIVAVSILASGCGSAVNNGPVDASSGADGSGGATAHGSSNDGALPACVWPDSLNPTDASDGRCVANQAYLSCRYPNGATEICVSDNLTQYGPERTSADAPPVRGRDSKETAHTEYLRRASATRTACASTASSDSESDRRFGRHSSWATATSFAIALAL